MTRTAHATVLERQARALELLGEGCTYDEIAEQLGYSSRSSAWKAVDRGLRADRDVRAGDYLTTQIDRYEAVLAAWWEQATADHDAKAALVVLRALERLDRVLRLGDAAQAGSGERLVISADPAAYVKQLQQLEEGRERACGQTLAN